LRPRYSSVFTFSKQR